MYICFKVFLNKNKKHFLNQDARLSIYIDQNLNFNKNSVGLDTQIMNFFSLIIENLRFIFQKFYGHIISVLSFAIFVYMNGGVALG